MRLIDADEVVKFYKNMGKEFPELRAGTHFSTADIISNLDNIHTVKKEKIMTMTNAEWMIKQGYKFSDLMISYLMNSYLDVDDRNKFVVRLKDEKVDEFELDEGQTFPEYALKKWLDMEHKEPILDDAERRYLSAVIRPFRDRAVFVKKIYHVGSYEQIIMRVKSIATDTDIADIPFPFFNEGKMYKGMKLNKEYTLEELGL